MKKIILVACLLTLLAVTPVMAQITGVIPYGWEAGDLALVYPAGWDAPVPVEENGRFVLQLAQTLADSPQVRPPGVPVMTLTLTPDVAVSDDLTGPLQEVLAALGITPSESTTSLLLGYPASAASGLSVDESLFGTARAVVLPDGGLLTIAGRALDAQRDLFLETFNVVADSLSPGATSEPIRPQYGAMWHTIRSAGDGESAFISLRGAALSSGQVYTVDVNVGVVVLDAASGAVINTYANPSLTLPTDVAIDGAGVVYVADVVCQCVLRLNAVGEWLEPVSGFGANAPASIAAASDGTLYATDQTDTEILVRIISATGEEQIALDPSIAAQPLLALEPGGRPLAITADGTVLGMEGGAFTPFYALDLTGLFVNDLTVDQNGNFLLATESQGVLIVTPEGMELEQVGRIVANFPLAGEVVNARGVASAPDGTIYFTDSDDTFGAITAMSIRVGAGRIGSTTLIPGVSVQGTLNQTTLSQDWILNGTAGTRLTISAVDASGGSALDVALRLIAPDGSEEAFNDDHESGDLTGVFDAQIKDHPLAQGGIYTVRVEWVDGGGIYYLGVSMDQPFELSAEGVTLLNGSVGAALPVQRWVFTGQAGQVLTITMQATSGTLDPILSLFDANANVLAENDDADDTALGRGAQLVGVRLPADGVYYLDARRFEGEGDYSIVIVTTS